MNTSLEVHMEQSVMLFLGKPLWILTTLGPHRTWENQKYQQTDYCIFALTELEGIDVLVWTCALVCLRILIGRSQIQYSVEGYALQLLRIFCYSYLIPYFLLYLFHLHIDIYCIVYEREVDLVWVSFSPTRPCVCVAQ